MPRPLSHAVVAGTVAAVRTEALQARLAAGVSAPDARRRVSSETQGRDLEKSANKTLALAQRLGNQLRQFARSKADVPRLIELSA